MATKAKTTGATVKASTRGASRAGDAPAAPAPAPAAAQPLDAMQEVERYLPLVEQIVVQVAVNFPRHVDRGELVRAGVLGWLAYRHGRKDERNAALEHSSELANDRAGIDADVRRLSDSELDDGLREFTRK